MELMQLKYFCEVAESQHMTRSAEKLHIAQPALSQAIHRLEGELGVSLSAASTCPSRCRTVGDLFTLVLRSLPDADPYEITTISTP